MWFVVLGSKKLMERDVIGWGLDFLKVDPHSFKGKFPFTLLSDNPPSV